MSINLSQTIIPHHLGINMDSNDKERPSVGLALSGGGARGLAHIGVLRIMEREGIPVDYLAGTSMGGVIAAGWATGMSSYDLEQASLSATRNHHMLRLVDPNLPNGGLIRGQRVFNFFKRMFGEKNFSDIIIPLAVVAVDLTTHQEVILQEGLLAEALRATTSIPGIFTPLEMKGMRLVDGGVLNNLPVDVVSKMGAEVIIAVNVGSSQGGGISHWIGNHRWVPEGIVNTLEVLDDTLFTLQSTAQMNKINQFPPDVMISPEPPVTVNTFAGYGRVKELISVGEQAAEDQIGKIKTLLQPR
jgi:NTE family protein